MAAARTTPGEAGVDGARAGVVMLAEPHPGDGYEQEHWEGEAEDLGEVLAVDGRLRAVPRRYGAVLVTEDTTPLEPRLLEYYASGVGVVREETLRGGDERVRLIATNLDD